MHFERYDYRINETFLDYEFESNGPKGIVKKIVRYKEIFDRIYNLAFGDLDSDTGEIRDAVATNNNDSHKVLVTVAATLYDFTLHHPDVLVFATGSSDSRTRLYRMSIANHLSIVSTDFQIFGLTKNQWHPFKIGEHYDGFLVRRK